MDIPLVSCFKNNISENTFREMMEFEESLRLSDFIQAMYQTKDTDDTIIDLVQQTVLTKFGFRSSEKDLEEYRDTINYRKFDRKTFPQHWIKHNIYDFPDFQEGDFFPKCKVLDKHGYKINIPEDLKKDKPVVIIASSDI